MKRIALMLAAFAASGCSQEDGQPTATPSQAQKYLTATLSCAVNGTPIGVSACLIGGGQTVAGSLKVASAGSVKQYTEYDLAGENGPTLRIPLSEPFRITAQANSESGYVLRMIITDGSKAVFQDEETEFGVIDADEGDLK